MPFASWLPTNQRVTGWLKNKYTLSWCRLTEMEAIHLRFSELDGQRWGESNWCLSCKLENLNDGMRGPFTQMAPRILFSALYLLCRKKQKSIMKHSGQKTKPEKFLRSRLRNLRIKYSYSFEGYRNQHSWTLSCNYSPKYRWNEDWQSIVHYWFQ